MGELAVGCFIESVFKVASTISKYVALVGFVVAFIQFALLHAVLNVITMPLGNATAVGVIAGYAPADPFTDLYVFAQLLVNNAIFMGGFIATCLVRLVGFVMDMQSCVAVDKGSQTNVA